MNIRKPHPNLVVRSAAAVNFSADQWGLKTDQFPRIVIEKVASYLNNRLRMAYNRGEDAECARAAVTMLFKDFAIYGAGSAKSKDLLDKIIKNLYVNNIKV